MARSVSLWYKPTVTSTTDRIIASNRSYKDAHIVVNPSGVVGYYKAGVFIPVGGVLAVGNYYHIAVTANDEGSSSFYLSGLLLKPVTDWPSYEINELGGYRAHEYIPSDDLIPSDWLIPISNGGIYSRACKGRIDNFAMWDRELTSKDVLYLANNGIIAKSLLMTMPTDAKTKVAIVSQEIDFNGALSASAKLRRL